MSTIQVDRIIPYQSSSVTVEGLNVPNLATTGSNTFVGNQNIQGTLTASIQEGFALVGGVGNVSTLVATSSFGGALPSGVVSGSSQLTASYDQRYALSGSGGGGSGFPFTGDAVITGSLLISGANTIDLDVIGQIRVPNEGNTQRTLITDTQVVINSGSASSTVERRFINTQTQPTSNRIGLYPNPALAGLPGALATITQPSIIIGGGPAPFVQQVVEFTGNTLVGVKLPLEVTGSISTTGGLTTKQSVVVTGSLSTTAGITALGQLTVNNNISQSSGNNTFGGNITTDSNVIATGNVTTNQNLIVTGSNFRTTISNGSLNITSSLGGPLGERQTNITLSRLEVRNIGTGSATILNGDGTFNKAGTTAQIVEIFNDEGTVAFQTDANGGYISDYDPNAGDYSKAIKLQPFSTYGAGQVTVLRRLDVSGSINPSPNNQVKFQTGSNQQAGTAVLDGGNPGTVTVSNSLVTANSIILVSKQTLNHPNGYVAVSSKGTGTFTITSNHNSDSDTVGYMIINNV